LCIVLVDNFASDVDRVREQKQRHQDDIKYFQQFRGTTFHEFWDMIGPPLKEGIPFPYMRYEEDLETTLTNHKKVWIKKATGLGITEFFLRWLSWNCLKNNTIRDQELDVSVILITGPRLELSIQLIDRLKGLYNHHFKTRNTLCILNGCRIEAFPSHHLAAARGLNPRFVFLDEADFFPLGEQEEARAVSERYIAKTNPYIIFVSTPDNPGGLYDQMEREEPSMYHKIYLDYKVGLRDGIFSEEEIKEQKKSPSFEREYNLIYGIGTGNIFGNESLDNITISYDLNQTGNRVLCVDPAFGNSESSSRAGIVGGEQRPDGVYITDAHEIHRASTEGLLKHVADVYEQGNYTKLRVDSAFPGLIRDWRAGSDKIGFPRLSVEEVVFKDTLSNMTTGAAATVANEKVFIHTNYRDLILQLKAVEYNAKGHPDKTKLNFDMGDAFLMLLDNWRTVVRGKRLLGKY